jgi:hypothetical protein
MIMQLRQLWRASSRHGAMFASSPPDKMPLPDIAAAMTAALAGCQGFEADLLGHRIAAAQKVSDLWMLRGALYQLVCHQASQTQADDRINALLPCFEGWLPANQLTTIG